MSADDKSKMNEILLMMALDSYRTRVKNDPNYKRCAEDALGYLVNFAIENDLLDTLPAVFLDLETQVFLEKEKRDIAK